MLLTVITLLVITYYIEWIWYYQNNINILFLIIKKSILFKTSLKIVLKTCSCKCSYGYINK